jgi:hypothetical protein
MFKNNKEPRQCLTFKVSYFGAVKSTVSSETVAAKIETIHSKIQT